MYIFLPIIICDLAVKITKSIKCRDGEIVGLKSSNNGRSCESHECCGESLSTDDLIHFRFCVLDFEDAPVSAR